MSRGRLMLAKPTMYCCRCNYALEGLREHRCPECGTPFNLDNPAKPRRRMKWACWIIATAILVLVIVVAS